VVCPNCGKSVAKAGRVAQPNPVATCKDSASRDELALAKTLMVMAAGPSDSSADSSKSEMVRTPRFLKLTDSIDRVAAGRRTNVAVVAVYLAGIGGPGLDWVTSKQPLYSVLATNLLLLVLWALGFAWLGALRDEDGVFHGRWLGRRLYLLWTGFLESCSEWRELEPRFRRARFGRALLGVGCVLVVARNLAALGSILFDTGDPLGPMGVYLIGAGAMCLVVGGPLSLGDAFGAQRASAEQARDAKASIQALPAILEPNTGAEQQFGQGDPVRAILTALGKWPARKVRHFDDEYGYQQALARHLRRHVGGLKYRREVWLGRARSEKIADLILGDLVLIVVRRGFEQVRAQRVIEEMHAFTKAWPGRPKILVVFDAERREILTSPAMATLQSLHASAELITVRM
jgi:hypothetical protein